MPSIVDCPSCSRKLKVPDELMGARVKCPTCGETFDAAAITSPPLPPPVATQVPLPPPVGAPVNLTEGEDPPHLSSSAPESSLGLAPAQGEGDETRPCPYCGEPIGRRALRCPYCDEDLDPEEDDRPWERRGRYGVRRDWEPHRATLVLVLGILSLVCGAMFMCYALPWIAGLPMGIIAWVMGKRDLRKMRANLMDPAGQGTTQAGYICGLIGTILNSLMVLLCLSGAAFFGFMMYQERKQRVRPFPAPPPQKFSGPELPLRLQDYLPLRR